MTPAAAIGGQHVEGTGGGLRLLPVILFLLASLFLAGCSTSETLNISAPTTQTSRYAAIVVDERSGRVLFDVASDEVRFPASLTKMMTLYLLFDAMRDGQIGPDSQIPVSANAAAKPASKLYLKAGETISVDTAIRALVVKSANDVATAVAEFLAGSETAFAARMTEKARRLGMNRTVFTNASGLPDSGMRSTARDMALLGMALRRNHAPYYGYFRLTSFEYKGNTINGHNKVLGERGVDGLKTGYTRASGFNLATSARRNGKGVVAVVLGGDSGAKRDAHMVSLLNRYLQR